MNPSAVCFWIVCAIVGWLIGDKRGALIGLAVSMGLSVVVSAIPDRPRRR